MKILYTIIIPLILAIQVYPQIDSTEKRGLYNKYKEYLNEKNYPLDLSKDIYKEYFNKQKNNRFENRRLQIIPIPPARKENSLIELLPLYKKGDVLMKFLQK